MAQRISRAKQAIRGAGSRFEPPPAAERAERMRAVLHVLYLMFNEGHTASSGSTCTPRADRRGDPAGARAARAAAGRRRGRGAARADAVDRRAPGCADAADGALVPLAEQDRARWDRAAIAEGVGLVTEALRAPSARTRSRPRSPPSTPRPPDAADTDWPQILRLYDLLERLAPGPMVALNRAVAVARCTVPTPGWSCSAAWSPTGV